MPRIPVVQNYAPSIIIKNVVLGPDKVVKEIQNESDYHRQRYRSEINPADDLNDQQRIDQRRNRRIDLSDEDQLYIKDIQIVIKRSDIKERLNETLSTERGG